MMNNEVIVSTTPEEPVPEKRVWGVWPTIGLGVVVLVVFAIAQTLVVGIAVVAMTFSQMEPSAGALPADELIKLIMDTLTANLGLLQSIATIVTGIIGTGLILMFIKVKKGVGIAEYLGLKKISLKAILLSIGVVIGFIVLADGLQILLGRGTTEQIMYDIYGTSVWPALFWVAVIFFAPLFEEAFFRGFLFEGFRQSRLGVIGAVVITSLAWALMHSLQYSIANIVWIFALGMVMGVVRWKTKSLWSTFVIHAFVNLVATMEVALDISQYLS